MALLKKLHKESTCHEVHFLVKMHAYACNFFSKKNPMAGVFYEYCEFFTGQFRATASELLLKLCRRFDFCEMDIVPVLLLLNLNRQPEEYLKPCQTSSTMKLFGENN